MGDDEAIIFSGSSCAQKYIEPETRTDAALESPVADEAYLFRGSEYALIDFFKRTLIRTGLITDEFPCLVNTMFASGIGTAFASHTPNQVYLFKDNFYVLIHFTPGEPNDSYIISGPEEIVPTDWPCLQGFIPFKTTGDETMEPKTWIPLKRRYGYMRFPFLPNDNLSKPAKPLHPEQCKPPLDYSYVQAAFHSTCKNEVFLFLDKEYVVINYDPASPTMDFIVQGPHLVSDGFPSLYCTTFLEFGITAAFGCHGSNAAFLFSEEECTKIIYAPGTRKGVVIKEPDSYEVFFPCLTGLLGDGSDAAFESMVTGEAFLFKGLKYFLINYSKRTLISTSLITDAFPCLQNTIFESNIESAFSSHTCNQAYLFKSNSYVLIRFSPVSDGSNDSSIIAGPKDILPNWPCLQRLVPSKRSGCQKIVPKTWLPIWLGMADKEVSFVPKI